MPTFLIRVGEGTSGLLLKNDLEQARAVDNPVESIRVAMEFDADCWCAAQQVYARYMGYDPYTLWPCKNAGRSEKACPHYAEQRLWLRKRLTKLKKKLKRKIKRHKNRLKKLEAYE